MGELADYYIEQEIERMGRASMPSRKQRPKEIVWTTADGRRLRPRDMGSVHIMNCLHLTERREGHMGKRVLNGAPTYKCMVGTLVGRGKLTWEYLRLPIEDRLTVMIDE